MLILIIIFGKRKVKMCLGFAIDTRKIPLSVVKTAKMRLLICAGLCVMIFNNKSQGAMFTDSTHRPDLHLEQNRANRGEFLDLFILL